jgi:hypothetical protein
VSWELLFNLCAATGLACGFVGVILFIASVQQKGEDGRPYAQGGCLLWLIAYSLLLFTAGLLIAMKVIS